MRVAQVQFAPSRARSQLQAVRRCTLGHRIAETPARNVRLGRTVVRVGGAVGPCKPSNCARSQLFRVVLVMRVSPAGPSMCAQLHGALYCVLTKDSSGACALLAI